MPFPGTSNVKLAMDTDLEALGTNAHELPMVLARARQEREGAARRPLQGCCRTGSAITAATS